MTINELANSIIRYQQYCSMIDPVRYASTGIHQDAMSDLYGMDPNMFTMTPAQRAQSIITKSNAMDVLVRLLAGEPVDDAKMIDAFGVSYHALEQRMEELNPLKAPIPDKTVILTFDDAKKDAYTHVAPLLKELGFNATFFVTEMEASNKTAGFADKDVFMSWDEIRSLYDQNFEIGNHSLHHRRPSNPLDVQDFSSELTGLNEHMEKAGIPRAISVAYPFGMSTVEQTEVAEACGFSWGRGNVDAGICGCRGKSVYDPLSDHPLAIPSYGDAPLYTFERLTERLAAAKGGKILCLAFHSVLDPDEWTNTISFETYFRFLKDQGANCIAMCDLEKYIDPAKALARTRWNCNTI